MTKIEKLIHKIDSCKCKINACDKCIMLSKKVVSAIKLRDSQQKYHNSPKGKAALRKAIDKYNASPKGKQQKKTSQDKYNASPKGKAARLRYAESKKGSAAIKKARAKYRLKIRNVSRGTSGEINE